MTLPPNTPAIFVTALLAFVAVFVAVNWKGRPSR